MRLAILTATAVGLAAIAWQDKPLRQLLGAESMPLDLTIGGDAAKAARPAAAAASQFVHSPPAAHQQQAGQKKTNTTVALRDDRNPLARLDRDSLGAIVERPLFSDTRRPPQPVAVKPRPKPVVAKPPPPRAPPVQLSLVGVIAGHGQLFALLHDRRTQKTVKVSVGDEVRGWRIATIEDGVVHIQHKRWKRSIALYSK